MAIAEIDPAETFRAEHLNLVYAAALRQMPGDPQSAADVTQAVFLVALKKAASHQLPEGHRMAGWLLKITAYTVKESRRAARRRSVHESQAAAQARSVSPEPVQTAQTREITALLDESLLKLGRLDREVLVRRYLRDESLPAVAAAVKMNENAASHRIARALAKLAKLLAHRGITAPAATLAAILLAQAAVSPPAALAAAVPASAAATSLAKLVLWRLTMAKATAIAIAAGILFMGTGAIVGVILASGGKGTFPEKPAPLAATAPSATAPAAQMIAVTAVTEDSSNKLLQQTLTAIDQNLKKLKTIEVQSVVVFEDWDAATKTWKDAGRVEGKAFSETAEPRRTRIEVRLQKSKWFGGAAPFYQDSFIEVWDGAKTRRLYGPPYTNPRGDISDKNMLFGKALLGEDYSLETMRGWTAVLNTKDAAVIERLRKIRLTARRVILNGKQKAVELDDVNTEPGKFIITIRLWFDPDRGYAFLGRADSYNGKPPTNQIAVDEMAEAAPGIFYPTKAITIFGPPAAPRSRTTFTATKVVANQAFDPKTFELHFPDSISVTEQPASRPATQR